MDTPPVFNNKDYPLENIITFRTWSYFYFTYFISESVSEIKYTRPNKFEEKVIAVYSKGKNRNTSPNQFVFGSFYESEIAEVVSPLSPKAFSYS